MTKHKGGLYAWRVDKPHALIGLPFVGRHWGYGGMSNNYYLRGQQHLEGSTKYGAPRASWSDLRPKCYRILPLPDSLLRSNHRLRRRFVRALETVMIWLLCPVYNDTQQPPYNLRKISRAKAAAMRANRDRYGAAEKVMRAGVRFAFWATVASLLMIGFTQGWWVR